MTKKISINDLVPGMIIRESVYNSSGQLVVPVNTVITDELITRLHFYSISSVIVNEPIQYGKVKVIAHSSYFERIQNTSSFQKFEKDFEETTSQLKDILNDLLERQISPEMVNNILINTASLLEQGDNSLHVFDMLHNMRELDDSTYVHMINVSLISTILGKWSGLPDEELNTLTLCGLLHDIGKLMIPPNILMKPGRLTDEEYTVIKTHPKLGYNLLLSMDLDRRVPLVALNHHERCDGSGYPLHLTRNKIHKFAKIVAIADVYDAMTAKRVYRDPICPFDVISIFEKEGYSLYDPNFMLPFLHNVSNSYLNDTVQLSNGEEGIVVMIHPNCYARPVVKCNDHFIDLAKEKDISISALK